MPRARLRLWIAAACLLVPLAPTASAFFCVDNPIDFDGAVADTLNPGEAHSYRHGPVNQLHDREFTYTLTSVGLGWTFFMVFEELGDCDLASNTSPLPFFGVCGPGHCEHVWVAPAGLHQILVLYDGSGPTNGATAYVLTVHTSDQGGEAIVEELVQPPHEP